MTPTLTAAERAALRVQPNDPPMLKLAKVPPAGLLHIDPDTLDRTLPGVAALATLVQTYLDIHTRLRIDRHTTDDADARKDIDRELQRTFDEVRAVWDAAHMVTGAEGQARKSASSTVRHFVVDADREARLARPAVLSDASAADLRLHEAYQRGADQMRSLVGSLTLGTFHHLDASAALP